MTKTVYRCAVFDLFHKYNNILECTDTKHINKFPVTKNKKPS